MTVLDIMIDHDDVVQPWFEPVDQKCAEIWEYDGSRGPCNTWAMHEFYGRTRAEWGDVVMSATQDGLYTTIDPFPYAQEAINRLRWEGHRVHIVTARGFMANKVNIRRWTRDYYTNFGIGYDTLTFAQDKAVAMKELLEPHDKTVFDFAIDDGPHNYSALHAAGAHTYLMDAPHNRAYDAQYRVSSLWEFVNIVLGGEPKWRTNR